MAANDFLIIFDLIMVVGRALRSRRRALDHGRFGEVNRLVTNTPSTEPHSHSGALTAGDKPRLSTYPSCLARRGSVAIAVLALTLLSGHVAPAVDANNRYVKLTPLGDRIRLAYTVFYGEIPGAVLRRTIDRNHDGHIDDAEAHAFGEQIGSQVAPALTLSIDGGEVHVKWTTIDVGMGTPDVDAGAFSVDLVAYACLPTVRGEHRVRLVDRLELESPGETEVRVEDSPGVTIAQAHVGDTTDPSFDFRFPGPEGQLADRGLELVFVAGPRAPVTADGTCDGRGVAGSRARVLVAIAIAALVAIGLVAALVLRRARRRHRNEPG
jgi:hypothetical protein